MRARTSVVVAIVLALSACTSGISPHGRYVTVHPTTDVRLSGELIAISSDHVWVLHDSTQLSAIRLDALRRIDVRRHEFGARKTLKVMAYAGAATGIALMISCLSYDGSEGGCVLAPPITTGVFLIPGALFALLNYASAWKFVEPRDHEKVRPYARFPQGLPDTLRTRGRLVTHP